MFRIGHLNIDSQVLLAPMAGITDLPFRRLCRKFGAGLTTSEMLTSDTRLWHSRKSKTRLIVDRQDYPVSMQIAGSDAKQLADAAKACADLGADIVDINMGCPAKKVCRRAAGSALLSDERLVSTILDVVVSAIDLPVTLKTRTGVDKENMNGARIAYIAQESGIKAIAMHGRTRACRFHGDVEYATITEVAQTLSIPVFANGDIDSPLKAKQILEKSEANAVLVGRAALGQPWLFRDIKHYLEHKQLPTALSLDEKEDVVLGHIKSMHDFYGEPQGVRIARKHFAWYCNGFKDIVQNRKMFNQIEKADQQLSHIRHYFQSLKKYEDTAA